jgi:hypothetical protein
MHDCLPGVGKHRRILPQKFLQLIQAADFGSGRRLAMAYNIGRNKFVERLGLTVIPGFQEASDHSLVLLRCRAHRCLLWLIA